MKITRRQAIAAGVLLLVGLAYWKRAYLAGAIYKTLPVKAQAYLTAFQHADVDNRLPAGMTGKIASIESDFNPNAYNPKVGATGIMQIVPSQHPSAHPSDPESAIAYAGKYLRQLFDRFGDWNKAIAAYNWGQGNLDRAINTNGANWFAALPAETRNYVIKYNSITRFS